MTQEEIALLAEKKALIKQIGHGCFMEMSRRSGVSRIALQRWYHTQRATRNDKNYMLVAQQILADKRAAQKEIVMAARAARA